MEECENCGRSIGKLETPHVINEHVVCSECHAKIVASQAPAKRESDAVAPSAQHPAVQVIEVPHARRKPSKQTPPHGNGAAMALGVCSLVLGIFALLASWIPFVGCLAIPLAFIGILLGFIGAALALTTRCRGIGFPIGGVICSVIALVIVFTVTGGAATAISQGAKNLSNTMKQTRLQSLEDELAELKEKEKELLDNKSIVEKVTITDESIQWREFSITPSFSLTVTNALDDTVTRINMRGKASSPSRPLPYAEEEFNYSPPGGMPPQSQETLHLSPNLLSGWDVVPKDDSRVVFEVKVIGVETTSGVYETELSKFERERLEELPEKIESLKADIETAEGAKSGR